MKAIELANEYQRSILRKEAEQIDYIQKSSKKYQGIIFDGYPRTIMQALYLNDLIKINKVLFIKVPDEVIQERIQNIQIPVYVKEI